MLYESQEGAISMALTGESLISRSLMPFREERFLRLMQKLRDSDVAFTNVEMLFHNFEGSPSVEHSGTWMQSDPSLIEDLKWAGFDIVSTAMNHSYDYGEAGVLANIANFRAHRLPFAGTGANLALASAPNYVDTPKGRVALIAACDHMQAPGGMAVTQRPDVPGKPGVNFIGVEPTYTVDAQALAELRRISESVGLEAEKQGILGGRYPGDGSIDSESVYHFMQGVWPSDFLRFELGDEFKLTRSCNQADLERNLKYVREARRSADWVLFSFHSHYHEFGKETPSDHQRELAHAVISEGADVFIGHGAHRDKGIEIFDGKPIFHGIGNFILQNDTIQAQPAPAYERYGLTAENTPADFYDARSAGHTKGQDVHAIAWQTFLADVTWQDHTLERITLHPVDLGMGLPMGQRGRPVLATGETAAEILNRLAEMSKPFGTVIDVEGDTATVAL
jgi:poly-gamma-glutamate synthesis protein (capsule biosynthesis protein)